MKNIIKTTLFFLVLLIGCTKDSLNNHDGTRLYKVSHEAIGGDSASTYTIEYDMNNRPVRILGTLNKSNFEVEHIDIEYDSAGRFSGYNRDGYSYTFDYDKDDRIIRQYLKGTDINGPNQFTSEYGYDNQDRLISYRPYMYDKQGRLFSFGGSLFRYDDNNNITEVNGLRYTSAYGDIDTSTKIETTVTYGTSPNPWNKIGMQMYFVFNGWNEWLMLSRNNPVSSLRYTYVRKDYTYEYYTSGYPKSILIKNKNEDPQILSDNIWFQRIEFEFQ